jgi:hypothetical protein
MEGEAVGMRKTVRCPSSECDVAVGLESRARRKRISLPLPFLVENAAALGFPLELVGESGGACPTDLLRVRWGTAVHVGEAEASTKT